MNNQADEVSAQAASLKNQSDALQKQMDGTTGNVQAAQADVKDIATDMQKALKVQAALDHK